MANSNGIFRALDRKADISRAQPERYTTLRQAAESLSRRNADTATVELFMEACQRLTLLAYEQDDAGGYCNIDSVTWRLLIPAPWGRNGHVKWGLRRSESVILREMIQQRQQATDNRPPGLWLYDRARKSWRLNLFDFDTLADGQRYFTRWPLTVADFRQAWVRRMGR